MLPLMLDLSRLRLALVGGGAAAARRFDTLRTAGAIKIAVFAPDPTADLARMAGARLRQRLPSDAELAAAQIVFIAGLEPDERDRLAARARQCGAIVHAEDAKHVSDAAAAAVLRRGDLTIAVSTSGQSPALAAAVKRLIGRVIGPEWGRLLETAARHRRQWRQAGLPPDEVARRTGKWLAQGAGTRPANP